MPTSLLASVWSPAFRGTAATSGQTSSWSWLMTRTKSWVSETHLQTYFSFSAADETTHKPLTHRDPASGLEWRSPNKLRLFLLLLFTPKSRAGVLLCHSVITQSELAFWISYLQMCDADSVTICVTSPFPATFTVSEKHRFTLSSACRARSSSTSLSPQFAMISLFIQVTCTWAL